MWGWMYRDGSPCKCISRVACGARCTRTEMEVHVNVIIHRVACGGGFTRTQMEVHVNVFLGWHVGLDLHIQGWKSM